MFGALVLVLLDIEHDLEELHGCGGACQGAQYPAVLPELAAKFHLVHLHVAIDALGGLVELVPHQAGHERGGAGLDLLHQTCRVEVTVQVLQLLHGLVVEDLGLEAFPEIDDHLL